MCVCQGAFSRVVGREREGADPIETPQQGSHEMRVSLEHFGDTCAVLPIGEPAYVITKGLKWDLGPDSCESLSRSLARRPPSPHGC